MAITKVKKAEPTPGLEPKVIKVAEELTCKLTENEWKNRVRELTQAHAESESTEVRRKNVMAQLSADLKTAKARESKLAAIVATREEQRDVTVEVKYDYELGTVTKTRTDTGEVISARDMTDDERQSELDLMDANAFIEGRHEEESKKEGESGSTKS